jgi:hypothetical protein
MPIGEEDYSNNLEALGRFKPGAISGAEGETGELDVTLATNLAGEPIRFTLNESLDNIVSSGTLTMLNATIGDDGIQYDGVMGEEHTEEDEAKWGELYDSAPVEPNQLCWVTEAGGGLGECTTYWRVVGVTAFLDEEEVPYYEVKLEGMGQIAIDTKFDPSKIVTDPSTAYFVAQDLYDTLLEQSQADADNDGYLSDSEEEAATGIPVQISNTAEGVRYLIPDNSSYLKPFADQIAANGLDCGGGFMDGLEFVPIECVYKKGESCWQIIETILGFSGLVARFNREKKLITSKVGETTWSAMPTGKSDGGDLIYDQEDIDNPPLGETDIGEFESGLQLGYTKEGVYSTAFVSGYLGKTGEDDSWLPGEQQPIEIPEVVSPAGMNILNGQKVEMSIQIDERYRLENEAALENYALKELFKTAMSAKSATYDSESVPLAVEVGMVVMGSSKLGGATSMYVTALNRTTDAQQNTIQTGISGTRVPSEADSTENNMGWE